MTITIIDNITIYSGLVRLSTIFNDLTICCSFCGLSTICNCITTCCRCIHFCAIGLNNAIAFNNSCFTACCFKGCRIHLHKIFVKSECKVSFILVYCHVFASNQLNFIIFTNLSILLSTCLGTRSSSIFICRDLPCLFPYSF